VSAGFKISWGGGRDVYVMKYFVGDRAVCVVNNFVEG